MPHTVRSHRRSPLRRYLSISPFPACRELERRENTKEFWHLLGEDGELIGRIMLPLASDYSDYQDRFYDALMSIGKINKWSSAELQEHIAATHADLFFVRLDQPMIDGTIPIVQARSTINAILEMLCFAAMATIGIRRPRKGQIPLRLLRIFWSMKPGLVILSEVVSLSWLQRYSGIRFQSSA